MTKELKSIYFLGTGGIGMSAIARYFHRQGIAVAGYDKTPSPLTDELIAEGIQIHFEEDITQIPKDLSLVVYTPAIPDTNKEYVYLQTSGIPFMKRSQVLGMITQGKTTYAIAGTHGKTTTTAITAHLLHESRNITAFMGGISLNFNSNLVDDQNSEIFIVEADEYDRSFLELFPDVGVITAMDPDHLDIYGDNSELIKSFNDFIGNFKPKGVLITKPKLLQQISVPVGTIKTYGTGDCRSDYMATNIRIENGRQHFDLISPEGIIENIVFGAAGLHNIENAVAASAMALLSGIGKEVVKERLASYSGVKRRFEYIIRNQDLIYIDDYAHHPQELNACIASARAMHPNRTICGIFQPHLYSRTRDFADEFAKSLDTLDHIILLDIYPAREEPIQGVSSAMLLEKIQNPHKILLKAEEVIPYLKTLDLQMLISMGAGDIDRMVNKIKKALDNE
ncbi:MAG: UDP-N-acetylmuramate--L-alanine ligase [Bacteroidales bacterium]|jgi:UDP-N-acetylmuramate--alanine ligase|nr:UDP-N-acetylmuramate--L-alanine ligase [Bacteroidales bacterium]